MSNPAMKGAGFAARLIVSYFITAILHLWLRIPQLEAFIIAFIIVMFPKHVGLLLKGGLKLGGKVAATILKIVSKLLESLFGIIKNLFSNRNKRR